MHKKRSQVAVEFLMTYGWAFLTLGIILSGLMYFNVLNVNAWVPDRVKFHPPFQLVNSQYIINDANEDTVLLTLSNTYDTAIIVEGLNVSSSAEQVCEIGNSGCFDSDGDNDCTTPGEDLMQAGNFFRLERGHEYTLVINCGNGFSLVEGDRIKFDFDMYWYPESSTAAYKKPYSSELTAIVQ